jgi:biopolymer transport protein TolR
MKRLQSETSSTIAKVNVTPIIDVALVLVIILMITAPMIAVSDVDVKLPEAQTRNLEGHDRISVTLGPNGELAVDEVNVTESTLRSAIAERLVDRADVIVVIRADQSVAYAAVRKIVEAARAAGAARIAVGTQQRGRASSYLEKETEPHEEPIHDARDRRAPSREEVKS